MWWLSFWNSHSSSLDPISILFVRQFWLIMRRTKLEIDCLKFQDMIYLWMNIPWQLEIWYWISFYQDKQLLYNCFPATGHKFLSRLSLRRPLYTIQTTLCTLSLTFKKSQLTLSWSCLHQENPLMTDSYHSLQTSWTLHKLLWSKFLRIISKTAGIPVVREKITH